MLIESRLCLRLLLSFESPLPFTMRDRVCASSSSSSRYHRQVLRVARPAGRRWPRLVGQRHRRVARGVLRRQRGSYRALWPRPLRWLALVIHGVSVSHLCVTDVDPVVFQCFFLVDLLLCCGRLPGCENLCRNQVIWASPIHNSLSPQQPLDIGRVASRCSEDVLFTTSRRCQTSSSHLCSLGTTDVMLLLTWRHLRNWLVFCWRESVFTAGALSALRLPRATYHLFLCFNVLTLSSQCVRYRCFLHRKRREEEKKIKLQDKRAAAQSHDSFFPPHQHHYPLPHDHMGSGCAVVCGRSGHALLPIHLWVSLLVVRWDAPFSMHRHGPAPLEPEPCSAALISMCRSISGAAVSKASSTPSHTTSPPTPQCCWSWSPTRFSSIGPYLHVSILLLLPSLSLDVECFPAHGPNRPPALSFQSSDIVAQRTTRDLHGKWEAAGQWD